MILTLKSQNGDTMFQMEGEILQHNDILNTNVGEFKVVRIERFLAEPEKADIYLIPITQADPTSEHIMD